MRLIHLPLAAVLALGCGRTEVVRYTLLPPDASVDAGHDAGVDAGLPDAGFDAGIDAGIDAGPCLPRPLPLQPALPTVMFVIDRSGSMNDNLDGRDAGTPSASRWRVLEASLRSVLPPLDQQIAMGALMYPVQANTCAAPTSIDLSPAQGNASRLLALFNSSSPIGGTPTGGALDLAAQHLRTLRTATSARALILATDGAPNCNMGLNDNTCVCTQPPLVSANCDDPTHCLDDVRIIAGMRSLFAQNLPTYVIGLGSQLNQWASTLDQMAVAGGVPRQGVGPRYYSITNQAELTDAFNRITAQLTRCTFLLNGLGPNDTFTLQVDGVDVPQDPNGWEWSDQTNGELALHGMACDLVARGATATVLVDCH